VPMSKPMARPITFLPCCAALTWSPSTVSVLRHHPGCSRLPETLERRLVLMLERDGWKDEGAGMLRRERGGVVEALRLPRLVDVPLAQRVQFLPLLAALYEASERKGT
jgi:hypothetical protein